MGNDSAHFIQAAVYFSNLVVLNLRDFVMFEEPIPLLLFLKSHVTSPKKLLEWSVTAARLHSLSEKKVRQKAPHHHHTLTKNFVGQTKQWKQENGNYSLTHFIAAQPSFQDSALTLSYHIGQVCQTCIKTKVEQSCPCCRFDLFYLHPNSHLVGGQQGTYSLILLYVEFKK